MGKGDKKSKKGKISMGSFGVSRPKSKAVVNAPKAKPAAKAVKETAPAAEAPKAKKEVAAKKAVKE